MRSERKSLPELCNKFPEQHLPEHARMTAPKTSVHDFKTATGLVKLTLRKQMCLRDSLHFVIFPRMGWTEGNTAL